MRRRHLIGASALCFAALLLLVSLDFGTDDSTTAPPSLGVPASTPSPPDETSNVERSSPSASDPSRGPLVNGVILFLTGGLWERYFFEHALPRLELHFLRCFPYYPVHIFHENLSAAHRRKAVTLLPSATAVDFEDVSSIWAALPAGVSEHQLQRWMNEGVQSKFQGRGYRQMCRFWSGLVWTLRSLDKYEFYWRLDTDSILPSPVLVDPFALMAKRHCRYGFNRLKRENPFVVTELWPTYLRWLNQTAVISPSEKTAVLKFMQPFALDLRTGEYQAPMYYNNFEMGTIELKRSAVLQDMFAFMDRNAPFGFLRFRWGDAPWHTLAVQTVLRGSSICNISKADVPYQHAARKPGPIPPSTCKPSPTSQ